MNFTSHFKQVVLRSLFVIGLLAVMAAPQLRSANPPAPFSEIRAFLDRISVGAWLAIGAGLVLMMLAVSWLRALTFSATAREAHPIQRMPVEQAISPAHGGNGLVSDAFPLKLPWLGFCGWVEVQTPGMEGLIVDGRQVIRKTSFHVSPVRLLGKPVSARRVLLAPEPQTIPSVEALSQDQWQATVDASITFRVDDPLSVLSKQPLEDLKSLAQGVIAEHIRTHKEEDLLGDTGELRRSLEQRLRDSPVLQGLSIVEVPLKVTGDERLIETRRLEAIERNMQDLVRMTGENRLTEAGFDTRIQELHASLEEYRRDQEQERQMEQLTLGAQSETVQALIAAVGQIARSGVDPAAAVEQIRELVTDLGVRQDEVVGSIASPRTQLAVDCRIDQERRLLTEQRAALGFSEIVVNESTDDPELPGDAHVMFDEYTLFITCGPDYPTTAPKIDVELGDGEPLQILVPWGPGSHLAHAVATAVMQIEAQNGREDKEEA